MKRRSCLQLAIVACTLAVVVIGVVVWSIPPQFQPEAVYRLKFGNQFPASRNVGDGTLIDFGPRADIDRYVVDLGSLADAQHIDRTFVLTQLPEVELVAGFEVAGEPERGSLLFEKPDIGNVRLEVLRQGAEEQIFDVSGSLADWVWSGPLGLRNFAFVYKYDTTHASMATNPSNASRRSLFTPSPSETYQIRVRADWSEDTVGKYKVRLLLKGGGWQA
jgi:hypothetical protein